MSTSGVNSDQDTNLKLQTDIEKYVKEYKYMYIFPASIQHFKSISWEANEWQQEFGSFVWEFGSKISAVFQGLQWGKENPKMLNSICHTCLYDTNTKCTGIFFTNKEKHEVLKFFASVHTLFVAKAGRSTIEEIVIPAESLANAKKASKGVMKTLRWQGVPLEARGKAVHLTADFRVCQRGDRVSKKQIKILKLFNMSLIKQFTVKVALAVSLQDPKAEFLEESDLFNALAPPSSGGVNPVKEGKAAESATKSNEPECNELGNEPECNELGNEPECNELENKPQDATPSRTIMNMVEQFKILVDKYSTMFLFNVENWREKLLEFVIENLTEYKIVMWNHKALHSVLHIMSKVYKNLQRIDIRLIGHRYLLFTNKPKAEVIKFFDAFDLPVYETLNQTPKKTIHLEAGPLDHFPLVMACPFHLLKGRLPALSDGRSVWLTHPKDICVKGQKLDPIDYRLAQLFREEIGSFKFEMECVWTKEDIFETLPARMTTAPKQAEANSVGDLREKLSANTRKRSPEFEPNEEYQSPAEGHEGGEPNQGLWAHPGNRDGGNQRDWACPAVAGGGSRNNWTSANVSGHAGGRYQTHLPTSSNSDSRYQSNNRRPGDASDDRHQSSLTAPPMSEARHGGESWHSRGSNARSHRDWPPANKSGRYEEGRWGDSGAHGRYQRY